MNTQVGIQTQAAAKPTLTPVATGLLQRQCACGNHTTAGGECEECKKKREGMLQRAAVDSKSVNEVPPIVHEVLRSPGQPLDVDTRAFMEPRFGQDFSRVPVQARTPQMSSAALVVGPATDLYESEADRIASRIIAPDSQASEANSTRVDFSQVRVHTDAKAVDSARAVNAQAYTVGRDVVFGAGQYAPTTTQGRRLLAHELAHVVQQADRTGIARMIRRNACGHDRPQGSGCGALSGTDSAENQIQFPADRFIAQSLNKRFPTGEWIEQLYIPRPNLTKGGKESSYVDAVKVTADKDLTLEIVEIKSRNNGVLGHGKIGGGCSLATTQTEGYIAALNPLVPRMPAISMGLEKIGGLILPNCSSLNKETKKKLTDAGINTDDKTDMDAWCVLNSVQNQLGRTFKKGFASVIVKENKDGISGTDYTAFAASMNCKGNTRGLYHMIFQVNQKGGISYRCEKTCSEKKRKELEKELEKDISKEFEIQTQTDKRKYTFDEPIGDEDPSEDSRVEFGPEGIDATDLAIWGTGAVAAMAALNMALKKAKTRAEKEIIRKTAEKLTQELARRGAPEVAKMLDSENISKLGTKAYQEMLEKAEKAAQKRILAAGEKRLAKKLAEKGLKKGAKTAAKKLIEKGVKGIPYIGAIITTVELLGAADAYAKGAEIQFGLEGGEAELAGDTNVAVKGDKPKDGPTIDAALKDTQIDIELAKAPDMTGSIDIEAKKTTLKGKIGPDDTPLLVNMKLKLENTTIIYKSTGKFKGGKVVIDDALNIKDSTIEIDLPSDAMIDASDATTTRVLTGVKIKITKVGKGSGQEKVESPAKVDDGDKATNAEKKEPLSAEESKLVGEIKKDERLKKIYDAVFGPKGIKVDKATLERFLALKPKLDAHPELIELIIRNSVKGEITDPIKQLIEPMEQLLAEADKKKEEPQKDTVPPTDGTTSTKPTDPKKDQAEKDATTAGPTAAEKARATALEYWKLHDAQQLGAGTSGIPPGTDTPTMIGSVPITFVRDTPNGERTYEFSVHGTLVKEIAKNKVQEGFIWQGEYDFRPPSGIINSTNADEPIYFTDSGTTRILLWGLFKKQKKK